MSHHINFDVAMSDQKRQSPKFTKSKESTSARRRENKKLEIDNKQMEWRLNQLKLAMEKEKEERGKQNYIWKSAHDGALDSHARNILGRSVKSSSKLVQKGNPPKSKVTILTDEPLDIPKRKSHSKELIEKMKKPTPPKKKPSTSPNLVENVNKECWISVSVDRTSDEILELQSDKDGNIPLPSLQGISPTAIGLYYMQYGRKRLLLAIENKIMQPKAGWGSEVYFPYVANISPQKLKVEPTPPPTSFRSKVTREDLPEKSNTGGNLLNGSFNEEDNAKAFQEALMEWRKGKVKSPPTAQRSVEMVVHDVQSDPVPIDITFSETSTLTFMEKLLVKRHRETTVPPLPNTNEKPIEESVDIDSSLTAEELEEHARFRDLFTPNPPHVSRGSTSTFSSESTCKITEVIHDIAEECVTSETEQGQSETICYVEEVDDDDDSEVPLGENRSNNENLIFPETKQMDLAHLTPHDLCTASENNSVENKPKKVMQGNNFRDPHATHAHRTTSAAEQHLSMSNAATSNRYAKDADNVQHSGGAKSSSPNEKSTYPLRQLSGLVHIIGDIPLNPDAVYQNDLSTLQSDMASERDNLYKSLNQSYDNILLCSQGTSLWSISDSVNFNAKGAEIDETLLMPVQMEEEIERENEDTQAINQLEWELASQTGHITSDGRISRLIDEWSSDEEELGIVNDPGLGSGLSTPDHDPISLVGTSMSWHEDDKMQDEFQKIENFMLADVSSDDGSSS